ncbi:uncharacterized protein G2W53_037437 [Senna tora]|uniref:Uncharacterized protein n=1 Tax=Senna tora TaxID=362788 RepID=A0A834WB34_9FABA|nr:uncharacterized protein G2W53_037437 [Senna tora]
MCCGVLGLPIGTMLLGGVHSVVEWRTVSRGHCNAARCDRTGGGFLGLQVLFGGWRLVQAVHRAVGPSSRRDLVRSVRRTYFVRFVVVRTVRICCGSSVLRSIASSLVFQSVSPLLFGWFSCRSTRLSNRHSIRWCLVIFIAQFCHRFIGFFVVSSDVPQSPTGAMPPVYPPFGSLFLDWSDAPIVVFHRSFGLSLACSSFSTLFRPLRHSIRWFLCLSVARSVGFCCLSTVHSAILLLPSSYPSSIPTFSSIDLLVRHPLAALSAFPSLDLLASFDADDYSRTFRFSGHEFEGSDFFIRGLNFIVLVEVQPGLGPPSYDYILHAQTFPAGGDVSRRASPVGSSFLCPCFVNCTWRGGSEVFFVDPCQSASDRPYHYLARSFLFWCRVPCAFLSVLL